MNLELATRVLQFLKRSGVSEICLCPGARSAPFVVLLQNSAIFYVYSFFEERSASFFCLGRIKATHRPVCIITTSGTAVTEMMSAVVEAYYTGLPLILLTADRPKSYRGTGAPQTIEQLNIYGHYAPTLLDLDDSIEILGFKNGPQTPSDASVTLLNRLLPDSPVHLNVCFDEPLLDGELAVYKNRLENQEYLFNAEEIDKISGLERRPDSESWQQAKSDLKEFLRDKVCPLILVSGLTEAQQRQMVPFLQKLRAPVYAEASSGLGGIPALHDIVLQGGDQELSRFPFDSVLRVGGVPTTRYWRDLESQFQSLPVLHLTEVPFAGMTHGQLLTVPLEDFLTQLHANDFPTFSSPVIQTVLRQDRLRAQKLRALLEAFPHSEPGLLFCLLQKIQPQDSVFVGNSLPIRELDLVSFDFLKHPVGANRGANGIDGELSTFLGMVKEGQKNWGIFGDLTTLCDLVAPWALKFLDPVCVEFVILNNGGGRIFSRMFESPSFQNTHSLHFQNWATFWGMGYQQVMDVSDLALMPQASKATAGRNAQVLEIVPNLIETGQFWKEYANI